MHLILPMAGEGSRFLREGILKPKPLLEFRGKPLYVNAINSFCENNEVQSLSFIVQKKHNLEFSISIDIQSRYPGANILTLDSVTAGAAETTYLCLKEFEFGSDPVTVVDADQSFSLPLISKSAQLSDFFIGTVNASSPAFSYVEVKGSRILRIVEKEVISDRAVAGIYGFRDASRLISTFEQTRDWPTAAEKYMSSLVTLMLQDKAVGTEVKLASHTPLGTPMELNLALEQEA